MQWQYGVKLMKNIEYFCSKICEEVQIYFLYEMIYVLERVYLLIVGSTDIPVVEI